MSPDNNEQPKDSSTDSSIRVLSLNGGGTRGLFTVSVLAEIEHIIAKKSRDRRR